MVAAACQIKVNCGFSQTECGPSDLINPFCRIMELLPSPLAVGRARSGTQAPLIIMGNSSSRQGKNRFSLAMKMLGAKTVIKTNTPVSSKVSILSVCKNYTKNVCEGKSIFESNLILKKQVKFNLL